MSYYFFPLILYHFEVNGNFVIEKYAKIMIVFV
jgi:hypothetical protein